MAVRIYCMVQFQMGRFGKRRSNGIDYVSSAVRIRVVGFVKRKRVVRDLEGHRPICITFLRDNIFRPPAVVLGS